MLLPLRTLLIAATCSLPLPQCLRADLYGGHDMAYMGDKKEIPPPEKLPVPLHMTAPRQQPSDRHRNPRSPGLVRPGLNLIHDFWDYEAARAFDQAVRVDPNCAMCFWGLARSVQGAYAHAALDTADHLKKHATRQEQFLHRGRHRR